ncbi:MAG: phenylalanine--tRNA ligase subunit beta [Candidatus Omnitrophica bacterium]|nr:phenylalanine--tRNA ligase subunit beta [Candidatus Omnitrophota bacterium]
MKFSLNFVKQFVNIDIAVEKLVDTLTMCGIEVEDFQKKDDDWVFDIEVTSNRYDWLSIIGIAMEIAACLGKKIKVNYPTIKRKPLIKNKKILIEDLEDCPFYIARIITNVKIKETDTQIKKLLLNCGVSSINNVVDITNYCMLKWGNPLHAFDLDKIEGDIVVRRAKEREEFVGIDGKQRFLSPKNLVIADQKKIIALAGVMGAKISQVDSNTKNILLEAAIFSPVTIRISRRAIGLDTEASYRFERKVFSGYLEYASSEAAFLMEKFALGKFCGYLKVGKLQIKKPSWITIDLDKLNLYLGINAKQKDVKKTLNNLGFKVKVFPKKLKVKAPQFRLDIEKDVDIYEEFIRIFGYNKIPSTIPALNFRNIQDPMYEFKNQLSDFFTAIGFNQIITYSIQSEKESNLVDQKDFIRLLNPLREEENVLRQSLLLGAIKTIRHNINRNRQKLYLYEIANVYFMKENKVFEEPALALAINGKENDVFYLKGVVEEFLKYLSIEKFDFKEESLPNFTNALLITVGDNIIGFLGKLDKKIIETFDLRTNLNFAQFNISLLKKFMTEKQYKPFSIYPFSFRDISMALRKDIKFLKINTIIREGSEFVTDINIIDIYKGKDIPANFSAFTLRIYYQSNMRTLTSQEVDNYHNNIREILAKTDGVILR